MPSKYYRLTEYLQDRTDREWVANFSEIEKIIGRQLPPSASQHQAWWSNRPLAQGHSWLSAGWRVARPDLAKKKVTFVSFVSSNADGSQNGSAAAKPKLRNLAVEELKAGLAVNFGVAASQIDIIVRL